MICNPTYTQMAAKSAYAQPCAQPIPLVKDGQGRTGKQLRGAAGDDVIKTGIRIYLGFRLLWVRIGSAK